MNEAIQLPDKVSAVDLRQNEIKPVYEERYMAVHRRNKGFSSCQPKEEIITDDLIFNINNSTTPAAEGQFRDLLMKMFRKNHVTVVNKVENPDIKEYQTVTKNTLKDTGITLDDRIKRKYSKDDNENQSERTEIRYVLTKENFILKATKGINAKFFDNNEKNSYKQTRPKIKSPLHTGALSEMEILQKTIVPGYHIKTSLSTKIVTDCGSQASFAHSCSVKDPNLTKPCRNITINKNCYRLCKEISTLITDCFVYQLGAIFRQTVILFIMLAFVVNPASTGDPDCKGSFNLEIKGPDILLSMNLSDQCELNGLTRWEGGPKEDWLTANNSTIDDDPKYQPIPRNGIFDLLIRNATAEDYNATYVFLNRFIKWKAYLPDLEVQLGKEAINISCNVAANKVKIDYSVMKLFSMLVIKVMLSINNQTRELNGTFVKLNDGTFMREYSLKMDVCNATLVVFYNFPEFPRIEGTLINKSGITTEECSGNRDSGSGDHTTAVALGLVCVVIVAVVVGVFLYYFYRKKKFCWKEEPNSNDTGTGTALL